MLFVCVQFSLQQILKRKNEFVCKWKKKDDDHSDYTYFELNDDQLMIFLNENEFKFENYLRLGFSVYNFSILGLF